MLPWACPVLPQYDPKQLMDVLKAKARMTLTMELLSHPQYLECQSDQ